MADDLAELEAMAGAMLRCFSPAERRGLMRRMARSLQQRQIARIRSQRESSGAPFEPRRKKSPPVPGRGATAFLYPSGGSGAPRRVVMKSFTWVRGRNGLMMTGYDIDAGDIRSFEFARVVKWLPVPDEHRIAPGRARPRRLRQKPMFRGIARVKYLSARADDRGFWVGFSGMASKIATTHHYGLRDRPSIRAAAVPYARRPLLDATGEDREMMLDMLYTHIASQG